MLNVAAFVVFAKKEERNKETMLFTSRVSSILLNFRSPPTWPAETNIPSA